MDLKNLSNILLEVFYVMSGLLMASIHLKIKIIRLN